MEAQAAVVEPEQAHHAHTMQRSYNKTPSQHQERKARGASPARRRKCPCTLTWRRSSRARCCEDGGFLFFVSSSSPQRTIDATFGAQVYILFPPHLIDEGCGDALRAWVGGCDFVHAACALRISAATSRSPTNVIGIFEPTAFSRNVLTNHRALENALLC